MRYFLKAALAAGLLILGATMNSSSAKDGSASGKRPGHSERLYGRQLAIAKDLGVGHSMDVAVASGKLYVIGGGKLRVADIADPASPRIVGSLGNLGNVRQIEVRDGTAYITAREDGMFIVDVKRPQKPSLLCHYDTIELATGICLSGDVAFVACRNYGVELVDVSDPAEPKYLSTVRTGEAQSVVARDGYLYAGVWWSSQLVVCDVRSPRKPSIVAKVPVDGFGDGVDVKGNYCYVTTGHHSRARPRGKPGDPGYGRGHGLETFDVSNPAKPVFVSRIKMPALYRSGMDMWSVTVAGGKAFVTDTYNGAFVVDVSDPRKPRFVAHRQLPYIEKRKDFSPAAGLALVKDYIYVAGAWSDLHVLAAPGLAQPPQPEADRAPVVPPAPQPERNARYRAYVPGGQAYAVAFARDTALVAAGSAGIHAVRLWPAIRKLAEYETEGFAMDVKVLGNHVYVAEARGGLSIWKVGRKASLARVGRYRAKGRSIKQVVVPPPGKYALLHVGRSRLHIIDVSDPARPRRVFDDSRLAMLYGYQITEGLLENRYACCFGSIRGFYWYDLYGSTQPVYTGDNYRFRVGPCNGMALLEQDSLVTYRGKYFILKRKETRPPGELPMYGVKGHRLTGKPSVYGTTLYVSDRPGGVVTAVDISELEKPKLLDCLELEGNPGIVVVHNGVAVIPAGHRGLIVWDGRRSEGVR